MKTLKKSDALLGIALLIFAILSVFIIFKIRPSQDSEAEPAPTTANP